MVPLIIHSLEYFILLTFSDLELALCVLFVDLNVLHVERIQIIDAVLNLCTYHHPENIQLPAG